MLALEILLLATGLQAILLAGKPKRITLASKS
jgi:hypothetical protein